MKLPDPTVINKDVVIAVKSGGVALGRLQVSKGSIDWWPAKASATHYKMTWEKFAETMETLGREAKK